MISDLILGWNLVANSALGEDNWLFTHLYPTVDHDLRELIVCYTWHMHLLKKEVFGKVFLNLHSHFQNDLEVIPSTKYQNPFILKHTCHF